MNFTRLIYQSLAWRGLNFLTAIILNIFMARAFGATGSGQINFVIAGFALVLVVGSLNLEASLNYFSSSRAVPTNQLVSMTLTWTIFFLLIFFFFIQRVYARTFPYPGLESYSFIFIAGTLVSSFYTALFYGQQHFAIPNIIISLYNIVLIAFLLGLFRSAGSLLLPGEYLKFCFVASGIQAVLLGLLFHVKFLPSFRFKWPAREVIKKILRYSGYALLANLLFFLLYRLDYWLIVYLRDSPGMMVELGNYIQVSKFTHTFLVLSSMIGTAVFSGTASQTIGKNLPVLGRLIRYISYFGLFVLFFFLVAGRSIFTLVYGNSFTLMYRCFLLLLPGIIALMTASVTSNYLAALGKNDYNYKGLLISLAIICSCDYLLIPHYGIYAAAMVSSLGYMAYALYLLVYFKRNYGSSWSTIFNYRSDLVRIKNFKQLFTRKMKRP